MNGATVLTVNLPAHALKTDRSERALAEEHMRESGLSREEWAQKVDRSRPIEACAFAGGGMVIGDGHHRHLSAEILGVPLRVRVYGVGLLPSDIARIVSLNT